MHYIRVQMLCLDPVGHMLLVIPASIVILHFVHIPCTCGVKKRCYNDRDIQSKNTECANIKHNKYFHLMCNFRLIHFNGKKLYGHMFEMVDTAFSYSGTEMLHTLHFCGFF